jgi:hypothetical protein
MKTLQSGRLDNLKDWLKKEKQHSVFKPQIMVYHTRGLLQLDSGTGKSLTAKAC